MAQCCALGPCCTGLSAGTSQLGLGHSQWLSLPSRVQKLAQPDQKQLAAFADAEDRREHHLYCLEVVLQEPE